MSRNSEAGAPVIIRGIHVENFLGIKLFDATIPPGGAVIAGRNGSGKTTVLKAVKAAVEAQGVSADAIHVGAAKAEIRIDLGHVSVRRVITEKTSKVEVRRTDDGAVLPAPQAYLRELLGVSSLDPLAFWEERDAKKRRAMLLDALPVVVTPAMLRAWCAGAVADGEISAAINVQPSFFAPEHEDQALPGHGLEVVERVRARLYDMRKDANRDAKAAEGVAKGARDKAAALAGEVGPGEILPVEVAVADVDRARGEEAALAGRRRAFTAAKAGRARLDEQIAKLREGAATKRAELALPPDDIMEQAQKAYRAAGDAEGEALAAVTELERQLEAARVKLAAAKDEAVRAADVCKVLHGQRKAVEANEAEAERMESQADSLAAAIGDLPAEPTADEDAALAQARIEAEARLARARRGVELAAQQKAAEAATEAHQRIAARAKALDAAVTTLAADAPRELLASAPGLGDVTIDGDVIKLAGVSIDQLSGREQMVFAVTLAKALNARGKILLVDGLEAVDPEQLPAFVEAATAGGYQLLAARVASGEARVEPIETAAPVGEGSGS